jgi:hypothetical protein
LFQYLILNLRIETTKRYYTQQKQNKMTSLNKLQQAYRNIENLLSDKNYVADVEYTVKYYGCSDKQWDKRKVAIVAKYAMQEYLKKNK